MQSLLFFGFGLVTGGIGTLIGAGGGFLLAPLFLFLFPDMAPARLTALSLLAVAANSTSGSIGYAYRRQVHWPSVFLFSAVAIPGVYFGVMLSHIIDRKVFEIIFAVFILVLSAFVLFQSIKNGAAKDFKINFWNRRAQLIGSFISFFIGIVSSLLGIGGGIVHVPLLSEVLDYPLHIAAGTSHSILAITSVIAVFEHFKNGDLNQLDSFVPFLVAGLLIGAQVGAAQSKKVKSHWILRLLGTALLFVGLRLIFKNWSSL